MTRIRLGLFFGGQSAEHEISILSARSIEQNIDKSKYLITYIGITKSGQWIIGDNFEKTVSLLSSKPRLSSKVLLSTDPALPPLVITDHKTSRTIPLDIVFPVLHGANGEDGNLQGLLNVIGLPFVGCSVQASVLGINKIHQKTLLRYHGIPVVDFFSLTKASWTFAQPTQVELIRNQLSQFPLIVKPANLGSSIGISIADNSTQLIESINLAFRYDDLVIIEKYLKRPREIEIAILGNANPMISDCGEISTHQNFYSYEAKYHDQKSTTTIPAKLTDIQSQKIKQLALLAYQLLGCSGLSRIDFFIDRDTNQIYFNEINTMPGFTEISMYPKLLIASGLSFPGIIDQLINLGLKRTSE